MKTTIASLFLITLASTVAAQNAPAKSQSRLNINELNIQLGFFRQNNLDANLANFKKLAPESVLLINNFSGYKTSSGFVSTGNTMFSVLLGVQFLDKNKNTYKANPILRIGISYFTGAQLSGNVFSEEKKTYDTLRSSTTSETFYIDSTRTKEYGMNYSSQQLRLDASLLFSTNPAARWKFYSGIGITTGLSFNARTNIYYRESESKEMRNANESNFGYGYSSYGSSVTTFETIRNKSNFGMSAYIPLGVDFRIGRREFWKRTHLFYEFRPSINYVSIPELQSMVNAHLVQGLGFKVTW